MADPEINLPKPAKRKKSKVASAVEMVAPRPDNAHYHVYALWVLVSVVIAMCPEVKGPLCGIVPVPVVCAAPLGVAMGGHSHGLSADAVIAPAAPAPVP